MHCQSTALDTWMVSGNISSSYELSYDQHCASNSVPEIILTTAGCNPNNQDGNCADKTSTIYTSDGETFANIPPMPVALSRTCVVALDKNDLFVTGGSYINDEGCGDESDKSYLYRSDTNEWEELPGLLTTRDDHMCARVHNSNGEEEVVVAGGFSCGCGPEDCLGEIDLVDIYNLQSGEWRKG